MTSLDVDTVNIRQFILGNNTEPSVHLVLDGSAYPWVNALLAALLVLIVLDCVYQVVISVVHAFNNRALARPTPKTTTAARPLLRASCMSMVGDDDSCV